MRLGLGTVQLGLPYGVSNKRGRPDVADAKRILATAAEAGMSVLDTAAAYGESEKFLGELLPPDHGFRIVTKTDGTAIEATLRASLSRLHQPRCYGLLVHDANALLKPGAEELIASLREMTARGLVQKTGVSVYSADQIDRVLERFVPDIVQVPVNVFDQRLLASGHLRKLKDLGVEIHARSIFLQGLLLMDPERINAYFAPIKSHLQKYRQFQRSMGLSDVQAALAFVKEQRELDVILVGVAAADELKQIVSAYDSIGATGLDMSEFQLSNDKILNPSQWQLVS
jgi:aryl-alcohol dehydrogenase-like predicted oxidoreductase